MKTWRHGALTSLSDKGFMLSLPNFLAIDHFSMFSVFHEIYFILKTYHIFDGLSFRHKYEDSFENKPFLVFGYSFWGNANNSKI